MIEVLSREEKEKLLEETQLEFFQLCTVNSKDYEEIKVMSSYSFIQNSRFPHNYETIQIQVQFQLNKQELINLLSKLVNLNSSARSIRKGLSFLSKEKYRIMKSIVFAVKPELYFLFQTKKDFKPW